MGVGIQDQFNAIARTEALFDRIRAEFENGCQALSEDPDIPLSYDFITGPGRKLCIDAYDRNVRRESDPQPTSRISTLFAKIVGLEYVEVSIRRWSHIDQFTVWNDEDSDPESDQWVYCKRLHADQSDYRFITLSPRSTDYMCRHILVMGTVVDGLQAVV